MAGKNTCNRTCTIPLELKDATDDAAFELGIGISEYLRLALIHLAEKRTIPFEQKRAYMRNGPRPKRIGQRTEQTA